MAEPGIFRGETASAGDAPASEVTEDNNRSNCQDGHKPARARSGMATLAYWRTKLYRNTYRDRQGVKIIIPEYYVRLRHEGITRQVKLDYTDKEAAAGQALDRYLRLEAEGWGIIDQRMARLPASPTVEEFCALYRSATISMQRQPRGITIQTYCRSLKQLCRLAGVRRIRELSGDTIGRARDAYRVAARKAGRDDRRAENTMAKILRNAAACFSIEARQIMKRKGLTVEYPFIGIRRPQKLEPVVVLPVQTLGRIYNEVPLLRDGDPDAISAKHAKKVKRSVDWRCPQPEAYAVVMLAIAAGLRANEIDKARWTWLNKDGAGNCSVRIGPEADFIPKGGTARTVMIQPEVYEAIMATRTDMQSVYIIGGAAKLVGVKYAEGYRRPEILRVANGWLRARGVEIEKVSGKPLQRLRKQFGSEIATTFGLFPAMRALGHSSHKLTSDYYAGQTSQPTPNHVRVI
jgi:hypothetical protein